MMKQNVFYPSLNYRRRTPPGIIFVNIIEDQDSQFPIHITITASKCGTEFAAYCESIARLCSIILDQDPKYGLDTVLQELSNITADRNVQYGNGVACRSGAEGIYLALREYKRDKIRQFEASYDHEYRPAVLTPRNM
jgi:hypothetical protein